MKKKTFITILLFLVSKFTFSQNWVFVGSSDNDDKYYMRSTSLSNNKTKKVWEKIVSKKTSYINAKGITVTINGYIIQLNEYDCVGRKVKILKSVTYNSTGKVLDDWNASDYYTVWLDVVPESVGEMMLDKACELF